MDRAGSVKDLASELLALKKASGSSFVQLSEKTHYAKSSWERWVNGKQFPPRDAVERLARLCGTDPAPLLALWAEEDARRAAPGAGAGAEAEAGAELEAGAGAETGTEAEPGAEAEAGAASRRRRVLWASVVLAVLLAAGAISYAALSGSGEPSAAPRPKPAVKVAGPATGCTLTHCEGRDPKKMNCGADAVTVRTGSIPKDLVIELRYSRACQAAWGRISFAQVGATVVVNNSDGAAQADVVHFDRDVYTPLIAAPDDGSVWVCAALPKNGARSCTGRFIPSEEKAQQP
ncbi:XRE family transcriptional regulator [Streptomyces sp. TLI_105]|uniref:helix-turn-helix domain-containing protein n=1 Tax=Streptomyces sp. TLI_105 TaxID=1881019 RepID=UPI0015A5C7DF|nr:XRE family transcriptional regulator [Streptomyces sp. TLI_105]